MRLNLFILGLFTLAFILSSCALFAPLPEIYATDITVWELVRLLEQTAATAPNLTSSEGWKLVSGSVEERLFDLELSNNGGNDFWGNMPCVDSSKEESIVGRFSAHLLTYREPARLILSFEGLGEDFQKFFLDELRRNFSLTPTSKL